MIEISNLRFVYPRSAFHLEVRALSVIQGEAAAVTGVSGSGKTTLLNLAAGILVPASGSVQVAGTCLSDLPDGARRHFRIANIGMIFQEFELLEYLNVRDNILLPYRVNRSLRLEKSIDEALRELLGSLEIASLADRYPRRLSQGERQRVAIGRALITRPKLIFADEPTGNLDPNTSRVIVDVILRQAASCGATVMMVTHDYSLLERFDRVVDVGSIARSGSDGRAGEARA